MDVGPQIPQEFGSVSRQEVPETACEMRSFSRSASLEPGESGGRIGPGRAVTELDTSRAITACLAYAELFRSSMRTGVRMNRRSYSPPYPVGAIANFMLDRGEKDARPITHLKLQKLVYMAYGWGAVLLDAQLFTEQIEAWRYGPVVPNLWHEFKAYKADPIGDGRSFDYDWNRDRVTYHQIPRRAVASRRLLREVWDKYSPFTAASLVARTHREGAPWDETVRESGYGAVIPPPLIQQHFKQLLKESQAN